DELPQAIRPYVAPATGPATLVADVRSITPSVLAPFVDAGTLAEVALGADASIELEADRPALDRLRGSIAFGRAELSLAGVSFDQQAPTRLTVSGGRVTIDTWRWGRDENRVVLRGGATLASDPALALTATAALDLRLFNALVPSVRTTGRADAEIHLAGTAQAPALDGYVTVGGGEARVADPRLIVSDITGTITLAGDTMTLHRVWASVNGGDSELSGTLHHRWLVPVDGALTLTARQSALDVAGLRAEADAAITWTLGADGSALGGTVTLLRSAYRERLSLTGTVLASLRGSSPPIQPPGEGGPSLVDRTRLDVRLLTDDDLLIDNNVARLTVHGDLRAVGTIAKPSVTGRAELGEGGTVFFNRTRYRLSDRRSIDFANPSRIEPDLDLSAVARVQGNEITILLQGTPSTLETTLESDNKQLSQTDLVSLLLVGRTTSGSADATAAGGDELVGLLTSGFLEAAGRAVGFDTARV